VSVPRSFGGPCAGSAVAPVPSSREPVHCEPEVRGGQKARMAAPA
jgi:hypothetical protein